VLDLSGNLLGDRGAISLAGSPHAAGLRRLALRSCGITDAGALALAGSPHLGSLRELALAGDNTIAAEAQALAPALRPGPLVRFGRASGDFSLTRSRP